MKAKVFAAIAALTLAALATGCTSSFHATTRYPTTGDYYYDHGYWGPYVYPGYNPLPPQPPVHHRPAPPKPPQSNRPQQPPQPPQKPQQPQQPQKPSGGSTSTFRPATSGR